MRKILSSLYGKIAAVFLLLLLVIGVVQVLITLNSSVNFIKETDQKLNLSLAQNVARAFHPYLQDSIDYGGIEHTIHYLMVINPRIEIYLLDENGEILASFMDSDKKIKQQTVNLEPIRKFLNRSEEMPILGDDPRNLNQRKTFSAAPIQIGKETQGYLYIILNREDYEIASALAEDSYIVRTSLQIFIISLVFAAAIGLISFAFFTKRLRKMTLAVEQFEKGNLGQRIDLHSNDEVGQLAGAFNQMADRIVGNIKELKTKDRMRRDLIANISHDLRSPLASLLGYLETLLMKESNLSQRERQWHLEVILKNAKRLNQLVGQLFELSKLDMQETRPKPEPFSPAELIQDVMLKFKSRADQSNIDLRCELPTELPMVHGDIGMIERALSNLIDNALNYTGENGEVVVELLEHDDKVSIKVSDTGRGIPQEDIPHVFDRFYRVDKSRARSSGGSGLGLAIAKKILEAHQSSISVRSVLNQGTTFRFELPVYA